MVCGRCGVKAKDDEGTAGQECLWVKYQGGMFDMLPLVD